MVIEGVPISVGQLSGWGAFVTLAFVVVTGFLAGRIYSGRAVDTMLRAAGERLAAETKRADTWQRAFEKSQEARELAAAAERNTVVEAARTMASALQSVQDYASSPRGEEPE